MAEADLTVGEAAGAAVEGSIEDLLLLITGRTAEATSRLRGPGMARTRRKHDDANPPACP